MLQNIPDRSPLISECARTHRNGRGDVAPSPKQNQLLARLPMTDYVRLRPHLEPVSLPIGWTVNHAGDRRDCLYFVTAGIVAHSLLLRSGKSTAFSVTGNEGVVGVASFLGGLTLPSDSVVLSAGSAYRLRGDFVRRELARGSPLANLLLRYTMALTVEIAQNGACNRHHSVQQQVCRYILSFLDRLPVDELTMSQHTIAEVLGVRREGVTEAIGKLQKAGVVHCRREHIAVIDRFRLEAGACECYAVVRSAYHPQMEKRSA